MALPETVERHVELPEVVRPVPLRRQIGYEILERTAFLLPPSAGAVITHLVEPGTLTESVAAFGGFVISSAVVAGRAIHRHRTTG